jgi:hypothetical protein
MPCHAAIVLASMVGTRTFHRLQQLVSRAVRLELKVGVSDLAGDGDAVATDRSTFTIDVKKEASGHRRGGRKLGVVADDNTTPRRTVALSQLHQQSCSYLISLIDLNLLMDYVDLPTNAELFWGRPFCRQTSKNATRDALDEGAMPQMSTEVSE